MCFNNGDENCLLFESSGPDFSLLLAAELEPARSGGIAFKVSLTIGSGYYEIN